MKTFLSYKLVIFLTPGPSNSCLVGWFSASCLNLLIHKITQVKNPIFYVLNLILMHNFSLRLIEKDMTHQHLCQCKKKIIV